MHTYSCWRLSRRASTFPSSPDRGGLAFSYLSFSCSCLLSWAGGRGGSNSQVSALRIPSKQDCKHRGCFPVNSQQGWCSSPGQTWTVTATCPRRTSEPAQSFTAGLSWTPLLILISPVDITSEWKESHSSCTNTDIYVLVCTHICPYTCAHMHTDTVHTYLLTCKNVCVHKHMHIHTQKCTCSHTHWQTLTLTCAVANAHTNADRHKYALRHRHMHMHMRKHSPSPHSENQDSTGQLSASVPLTTFSKSLKAQC